MKNNKVFKFDFGKLDPKRLLLIALLIAVGLFLMLFGGSGKAKTYDEKMYVEELENSLETMLEAIDGVGDCDVMITLENSGEAVYAGADFSSSSKLVTTNQPSIRGVAVICAGGDNSAAVEEVIKTVKSLTDVSASKISVSKKSS